MNTLIKGKRYKLRVWDEFGNDLPDSKWPRVIYNGKSLIDKDGGYWTEWIDGLNEDILED